MHFIPEKVNLASNEESSDHSGKGRYPLNTNKANKLAWKRAKKQDRITLLGGIGNILSVLTSG